jgi:hypothetical protein
MQKQAYKDRQAEHGKNHIPESVRAAAAPPPAVCPFALVVMALRQINDVVHADLVVPCIVALRVCRSHDFTPFNLCRRLRGLNSANFALGFVLIVSGKKKLALLAQHLNMPARVSDFIAHNNTSFRYLYINARNVL